MRREAGSPMSTVWRGMRWALAAFVVAAGIWLLARTIRDAPGTHNIPFEQWYGNWKAVLVVAVVFIVFLLGFARPRRRVEWRNAGMYSAFLISLFTEMFGLPLTIYLLAPALGLPAGAFGMNESHLWAFALERLGLLPVEFGVYIVMMVSVTLIALGVALVPVGWASLYRYRGGLVTEGIYRHLRHPQYLGLMLIVVAFNIQWPTLPTLLMGPALLIMYARLARREDRELAVVFGPAYIEWAARTRAYVPWRRLRQRPGQGR